MTGFQILSLIFIFVLPIPLVVFYKKIKKIKNYELKTFLYYIAPAVSILLILEGGRSLVQTFLTIGLIYIAGLIYYFTVIKAQMRFHKRFFEDKEN